MGELDLTHRLSAILAADAVGYTRLMESDARATVAALEAAHAVFREHARSRHGRVINTVGDSVLVLFETASGALDAATAIQDSLERSAAAQPEPRRMHFRIGLHLGDVIAKADGSVYGDGVNVAARLQALAPPGAIVVSESFRLALRGSASVEWRDLGEQQLKNVSEAVRAFQHGGGSDTKAGRPLPALSAWDKPSIAVLPFANLSGDADQDYLADGIAEDIITELSRFGDLSVIARNSTFAVRADRTRPTDPMLIARELDARFALEGSVRRHGDRVRIAVKLFDTTSGEPLWAERYDGELAELSATQDEITQQIVASVAPQIQYAAREGAHYGGSAATLEPSLKAAALIWRGWDNADVPMISRGIEMAEKALAVDPRCQRALAMIGLGCQARAEFRPMSEAEDLDAALSAAKRLQAIDAGNHVAWLVLGIVGIRRREHESALACVRRAHALNPNDVLTLRFLAWEEANWGHASQALEHGRRALQLSPRDPALEWIHWVCGLAAYVGGDLDTAIAYGREAKFLNPRNTQHWGVLAASLAERGDLDEAHSLIEIASRESRDWLASRLQGKSYFALPEMNARYAVALRKAAGPIADSLGV